MGTLKVTKKITASILTAVMVFLIPADVYAVVEEDNYNINNQVNSKQQSENEIYNIVSELNNEEDAYTRCFALDNGETLVAKYDIPVNYQTEAGDWVQYDNTMKLQDEVNSDADNQEYENISSDFSVKLANKSKDNNMVKISYDHYDISWGFSNTNKSKVKFVENATEANTMPNEELSIKNLTQEAIYKQVYNGVDLQYIIGTDNIKENLIINSKDTEKEFTINYKVNNVNALSVDDKTIELRDKANPDKTIYKIEAPVMTDAGGAVSDGITLTLAEQKGNKITVKLAINSEWLNDTQRQFPVTVDPELSIECNTENTESCTIYTKRPNNRVYGGTNEYIGYNSNFDSTRAIYKINQLYDLNRGDYITSAKLQISASQPTRDMNVYLHKITSTNAVNESSWNNTQFDSQVLDYDTVFSNSSDNSLTFDITQSVKEWYNDPSSNTGLLLESDENTDIGIAVGNGVHYFSEYRPIFLLTYKNYIGTENSLTYHQHSLGNKGTASIGDALGNLVISQSIFEGTGNRLPVSINVTYNSILFDTAFGNSSPCGYGFQFSFNEYIEDAPDNVKEYGYDYVYTDADGTKLNFKPNPDKAGEWLDENDYGYTLTKDDSSITITDSSDTISKFALPQNGGNILSQKDSQGNETVYGYNNGYLSTITDCAGRVYTVNYIENTGKVGSITAPDGKIVTFAYNNDRLESITYADGTKTTFQYNSNGLINYVHQSDGSKILYTYKANKVSRIVEYGTSGSQGNYMRIAYNNDNTTTFTDKRDRYETYTFNNAGETISVINDNGYIISTDGANSLSAVSGYEDFTKNYFVNSNADSMNNYTVKRWNSSNTAVASIGNSADDVNGEKEYYLGTGSLKISQSSASDITTVFQTVNASALAGTSVTFSAYLKTDDIKFHSEKGVLLRARYLDANGNQISIQDGKIYGGTRKWQRVCQTFNVPQNAAQIEIHFGLKETTGTAWFDCLQLEEGECMNNYNALENYDFSTNYNWTGGNALTGLANQQVSTSQEVLINRANVSFNISGSASANSLPLRDNRQYGIKLSIYYADSDTPEEHIQSFNECTSAQQATAATITPERSNILINKVVFSFIYDYNIGNMTANKAMLNMDLSSADTIFDDIEDDVDDTETDENATEEINTEPYQGYVYNYDTFDNVTQSSFGTVLTDSQGNETLDSSKPHITTSTTYNSTGNYITSETDSRGKTITYNVNDANGIINSVTDAKGNTVSYTYGSNSDNITAVSSSGAENNYSYNASGLLSSISHNGFSYNFTYDAFGNNQSVSVGNSTLATNSYGTSNYNLVRTTYGNGDYIKYTYDRYDRVSSVANDKGTLISYVYNKKGLVAKTVDYSSGITTEYLYSMWGSLQNTETTGTDNNTLTYQTVDENGNAVSVSKIKLDTKTVTAETDEDGNSIINNDGWKVTQSTDELDRALTETVTPSGDKATPITKSYTYVDGNGTNETTELVKSITYKQGEKVIAKYSYEYDDNNNISKVYENDELVEEYTYDNNNQLYRLKDYKNHKQAIYSYDNGGNINNTNEQYMDSIGLTSGSLYGGIYCYNDTEWKDKLTKYNSYNITYDEVGNPLNYRNGMSMTWENGRQLKELIVNDELTVEYEYNANGLRTKKSLYDGTDYYNYYYDENNNLTALCDHYGKIMQFYYGADGTVVSMRHKDIMYYYVKNLQGDITALVKADGTVVANYSYDVWGKVLSITDANGNKITDDTNVALINPFRYRGYVYDDESGLYYLQSRYYDPETGRFVNADVYTDTGNSILSTNMFAYCENNPVNAVDPTGEDAWWLQDTNAVFGCGHTSLLIQESKGKWWYFYWGPNSVKLIYIGTTTLSNLNKYLHKKGEYDQRDSYTKKIHLYGNFYGSLKYICEVLLHRSVRELKNKGKIGGDVTWNFSYDLLTWNCMQVSATALMHGTFKYNHRSYIKALTYARLYTIPNWAYSHMILMQRCFSLYGNSSYNMINRFVDPWVIEYYNNPNRIHPFILSYLRCIHVRLY